MRSVIARIGVILTVWTACVVWFSVSVLGGAAIHVEEPIYDFGAVIDGTVVEHFFEIENHGDEDLVIEDVRVGCGCTIVELPMRRLIPRRSVRLGVSLSTSGYAGLEVSKSVYLTTNDPAQPQLTLTLQGRIVPQEAYLIEVENLSGKLRLLIDLRSASLYAMGHLLGATSIPAEDVMIWLEHLPKEFPIVLYDTNGKGAGSVAEAMLAAGFLDVQVLVGGFQEWTRVYGNRMVTTFDVVFLPILD